MKLYLMRHGETDWNTEWKLQGRTDIPLNSKGIQQAKEACEKLKHTSFDVIFCSPLDRAKTTAETIAKAHNMEVIADQRLTEMSFGEFEGTSLEYNQVNPMRDKLFRAPGEYVAPRGGESFQELNERCEDFIRFLREQNYKNVLIVAHGALIRGLVRAIKQLPLEEFWESGVLNNCEAMEIEI